jgi:ankyrin repeat protein
MGNIFNWFKHLETLVMNRRDDKYAAHRFEPNHPERLSPDQLITTKASGQKSASLSSPITTTTEIVTSSNKCSNFYLACRNNKIEEVKQLLKTIKPNEIDKIEPNGSTALHAACYHGHHQIVKLLLEAGADRAIPNKYKCLPFDEAKNEEIKKLFFVYQILIDLYQIQVLLNEI